MYKLQQCIIHHSVNKMNGYQCMNHHFPLSIFFIIISCMWAEKNHIDGEIAHRNIKFLSVLPIWISSTVFTLIFSHCIYSNIPYATITSLYYSIVNVLPVSYSFWRREIDFPVSAALTSHNRFSSGTFWFL